jgi:COP9 signalosome complex subunit 7
MNDINVQQSLQSGSLQSQSYFNLLKLFAFGTFQDYVNNKLQLKLPDISPAALYKLKQLSLLSYASDSTSLSYSYLNTMLHLSDVRSLENLIFDCINQGLMVCTLDQKMSLIEVSKCQSRDITSDDIVVMKRKLEQWLQCNDLITVEFHQHVDKSKAAKQQEYDMLAKMNEDKQTRINEIMYANGDKKPSR